MTPSAPQTLFVYGTLRHGADNDMQRLLARQARHIGPAWFQGQLFRVSDYPGVIASDDPTDQVVGDLYELPSDGALLAALDDYEGCSERFTHPQEYLRTQTAIRTLGHADCVAWIYLFQRALTGLERIASGDFLAHSAGPMTRASLPAAP